MKLYHRTEHAQDILSGGFKDGRGNYGTGRMWEGVWLSNVPLDSNEGASGDTLLSIDIPEEGIGVFEWIEDDKPYREFLIPAEFVNSYGSPIIVD